MSRALMESLRTDMKSLAKLLQSKGRKGDKILAHITPKEAALLKKRGGAGTKNPDTGLPEFAQEGYGDYDGMSANTQNQTPYQNDVGDLDISPPAPYVSQDPKAFSYTGLTGDSAAQYGMTPFEDIYAQYPGQIQYDNYAEIPASREQRAQTVSLDNIGTPSVAATNAAAANAAAANAVDPSKPGEKSFYEKSKDYLSNPANALRLGLTGATGLYGVYAQKKMAEQNQKATREQKALAKPYQEEGKRLMAQAQRGELSSAGQVAYQNAIQQANQAQANRGGAPDPQAGVQLTALYNQLLENQYKYGIQIAQVGDQIQLGAIQNGLKLDQQLAQTTQNFYASLAGTAAGMPAQPTTPRG